MNQTSTKPLLDGIKVIDLTVALSGPFATNFLAFLGADIIKIEDPTIKWKTARDKNPEELTASDILSERHTYPAISTGFTANAHSRRGMCLNFKTTEGKEIFYKLVKDADVVINNWRPGVADKLGIGYEKCKELNPRIIYTSITGYGSNGPWAMRPAYDLVIQAVSGMISLTGEEGGPSYPQGFSVGDYLGGTFGFIATLQALYARERYGVGQKVESSLLDAVTFMHNYPAQDYFVLGKVKPKVGLGMRNGAPAYKVYNAKGAEGIVIAGGNQPQMWPRLCKALGKEEWLSEPRYENGTLRNQIGEEIDAKIQEVLLTRTAAEWEEIFLEADLPVARVNTLPQILNHPQMLERDRITKVTYPSGVEFKMLNYPIQMSETPQGELYPAPLLGQHTDKILSELGYSQEKIEELRVSNAIF